jgi:hypothetical protein
MSPSRPEFGQVLFGLQRGSRTLQFIHGRLSVPTPCMLHHAPLSTNAVVEPWNWAPNGVWYFVMGECHGVPLNTVIDSKPSTEPNSIAYQLLVILIEMCSFTSTTHISQWRSLPLEPPTCISGRQGVPRLLSRQYSSISMDKNTW